MAEMERTNDEYLKKNNEQVSYEKLIEGFDEYHAIKDFI